MTEDRAYNEALETAVTAFNDKRKAEITSAVSTINALGADKEASDGATASYYELPKGAEQLQDLIAYLNLNAQLGEIFRACYRYGRAAHSDRLRDAKKIAFYAAAEIKRLETYGDS